MLKKEQRGRRKKMLKNKIIALLTVCSLCMPVLAVDENLPSPNLQEQNPGIEAVTAEEVSAGEAEDIKADEAPQSEVVSKENNATPYKQPTSKKKIMKKFLLAMLGVAGSSILLFAILSIYNRVVYGKESVHSELKRGESQLETPETINEAVKSFVDKTTWEN